MSGMSWRITGDDDIGKKQLDNFRMFRAAAGV